MKQIDFTKTGGIPFTQDILSFLQSGYTDALLGIAALAGTGPYIISGMTPGSVGGLAGITSGWLFYNGELLQFTASATPGIGSGNVLLIKIQETDNTLTYGNGTVYNVLKVRTAYLAQGPTATDATQFPYSLLQPLVIPLGLTGRETAFNTIAASTIGGVSGTIYYKKNLITNCLQMYGTITASNAQSLNGSVVYTGSNSPTGPLYYAMCTLPAGYRPNTVVPFTASVRYHNALFLDDLGSGYLTELNGEVQPSGVIAMGWRRPSAGVPAYAVSFNVTVPLD